MLGSELTRRMKTWFGLESLYDERKEGKENPSLNDNRNKLEKDNP